MFTRIPPASLEVLKALSFFHYLNNDQLVELGIAKSDHSLNAHALRYLVPRRDKTGNVVLDKSKQKAKYLCNNLKYGNKEAAKKGVKLPYLHFMTQRGKDYLYWACEDELTYDDIWFPKPKEALTNDYFHRTNYVSTHIYIRRWAQIAGAEIDFATHDYQADPNKPPARGRPASINEIIWDQANNKEAKPDGIFGIDHKGKKRVFLVELHRTTQTKLVVEQLYRNFRAGPAIRAKFHDYPVANDPFILSVHDKPGVLKATRKRVMETPAFDPVRKGVLFAQLEDLRAGFADAWTYADGSPVPLFMGGAPV